MSGFWRVRSPLAGRLRAEGDATEAAWPLLLTLGRLWRRETQAEAFVSCNRPDKEGEVLGRHPRLLLETENPREQIRFGADCVEINLARAANSQGAGRVPLIEND